VTFEQIRRRLFRAGSRAGGGVLITVTFADNDVPDFLRELRRFQRRSGVVRIVAKGGGA